MNAHTSQASRSRPRISSAASGVASKRTFAVHSPIDGTPSRRRRRRRRRGDRRRGRGGARGVSRLGGARTGRAAIPILKRFAQAIRDRLPELAAVETADNGSLLIGNLARVVPRAALNIEFFADWALKLGKETIDSPEVVNHVRFDPSGVAALITPWNAPFMLTTWKVGPALAAGNTAVVKPPEWAPLTCSLIADIAAASGRAARRAERRARRRRGGGRGAGRASRHRSAELHRLDRHGEADRPGDRALAHARSASSSAANPPSSSAPTPISTPRRRRRPHST